MALACQGFYTDFQDPHGVLTHLGYVQIDAISRITRAHHHIFWSRHPRYQPEDLNTLLHRRQAFEYWGHAASYLPLSDYPYYFARMQSFLSQSRWGQRQYAAVKDLLPDILRRIETEGPLQAKDFKGQRKGDGWWQWKPAKIALELLYWQGKLMVVSRQGFHKVYDLRERFLPAQYLNPAIPSGQAVAQFCVERALSAHGLMTEKQIRQHLPLASQQALKAVLQQGLQSGALAFFSLNNQHYYIATERWESFQEPALCPEVSRSLFKRPLRILSPFDNLVIQRERLRNLWDCDYRFEAYVPAPKRVYGYFTLPVWDLERAECLAFIELRADRAQGVLQTEGIWPQVHPRRFQSRHHALSREIQRFASFQHLSWQAPSEWKL